jgi:hypothetical protein
MPVVQSFVRCDSRSMWLVITPKSKDRFIELPPMKTVQPGAYMGTAWHSMWWSLVLAYQPVVWGSYDGRTVGMFGEAAMAEPWDSVGTAETAGTHKTQEMFSTGITSIYAVKVSIATNKNLNPPGALGKTPTMLIPHIAQGQEGSIGQRGFACFDVCFQKNLQYLHLVTTSIASFLAIG